MGNEVFCEYCGKPLPLIKHTFSGNTKEITSSCDCDEAKQAREEEAQATLDELIKTAAEKSEESRRKEIIRKNGIGKIYKGKTFDDFIANTDGQKMAKMLAVQYTTKFNEGKRPGKCLILHGNVGTGKTLLASIICNNLSARGIRCLFVSSDSMMGEIRETFKGEGSEMGAKRKYMEVPVLILDDLGKEKASEWQVSTLFEIIDYRYSSGLPTVVTANHSPESLINLLTPKGSQDKTKAEAIVSRLQGGAAYIIPMYWEDYRTR